MIEEEGEEDSRMSVRNNLSSFIKILSSYNSNVLLAALVFLLLVVLFVLLLHFYARYFWSHSDQEEFSLTRHRNRGRRRRRTNRRRTVTTTRIIPSLPLGGSNGEGSSANSAATANDDKGLDSSVISKIPLFVYEEEEEEEGEEEDECVICLGLWEVGDFGRKLRNCGHGFHVECIDMWLSSHSTCPLCRSPVLAALSDQDNLKKPLQEQEQEQQEVEVRLQLSPSENVDDDRRISMSHTVIEDDLKTEVEDREGEVRIEVFDEEINGEEGSSRSDRRSTSSSSLMRMLSSSSRSERNRVRDSISYTINKQKCCQQFWKWNMNKPKFHGYKNGNLI